MSKRNEDKRHGFLVRLPVDQVQALDRMAKEFGLSRNQMVTKLVGIICGMNRGMEKAEAGGLFKDMNGMLEELIEGAIRKAMREGGMDLALYRAEQIKKNGRRITRKAGA